MNIHFDDWYDDDSPTFPDLRRADETATYETAVKAARDALPRRPGPSWLDQEIAAMCRSRR